MKNLTGHLFLLIVLFHGSMTVFGQAKFIEKTNNLKTLINQYAEKTIQALNKQNANSSGFKYRVSNKNTFYTDMNGDGEFDAIVEIFFCEKGSCHPTTQSSELVVFIKKNGNYYFAASKGFTLYGKINSIEDGTVRVDVYDLDEGDPQCCPELKRIEYYSLKENRLIKVIK